MLKLIITTLTGLMLFFAPSVLAQEEMSPEQKAWMDYMTPGAMHEMMAKSVGDWKTVNKFWTDPESEPMVNEGTARVEMILGGRYMQTTHHSTVMGMPMEGINLQCYDNATQQFTAVWIDNLGTGMSVSTGVYDGDANTINYAGTMVDPMTGDDISYRSTHQIIDDNHQIYEMFMTNEDGEFRSMVVELSR